MKFVYRTNGPEVVEATLTSDEGVVLDLWKTALAEPFEIKTGVIAQGTPEFVLVCAFAIDDVEIDLADVEALGIKIHSPIEAEAAEVTE